MNTPRAAHQATLLSPTEVLLSGGCSGAHCEPAERSAEILNTTTGQSLPTQPMHAPRIAHTAAPLPDGGVLVSGGWTGTATTASAEIFDRHSGSFRPVGPMTTPRMDATATPLRDGKVLIAGGARATNQPLAAAEVFDTSHGGFRPAASMAEARAHHAAVRLADGRVLVMGGLRSRHLATRSAEIYDPVGQRFVTTGAMLQARCKHAGVLLSDGRVMVLAGSSDCDDRRRLAETEIYDPKTGRFTAGPKLLNARYKIASAATVLPSGAVLIAGDADDVEVWMPGQPKFSKAGGGIGRGLAFSTATALPNGEVLVTGGYDEDIRATAGTWRVGHPPVAAQ